MHEVEVEYHWNTSKIEKRNNDVWGVEGEWNENEIDIERNGLDSQKGQEAVVAMDRVFSG